MKKRNRYPEHFNTKREMLWYIKGLMDAKGTATANINSEIDRYRNSILFTEFKENLTKHNNDLSKDCPKCDNGNKIGTHHSEQYCGFCGRKLAILR